MSKLEISRMVTLSTAHIPTKMREIGLENYAEIIAHPIVSGWLVYVDPFKIFDSYSSDLRTILYLEMYAQRLECDWILFDSDAEPIEELKTFDLSKGD